MRLRFVKQYLVSWALGAPVTTMGLKIMVTSLLLLLIGLVSAEPMDSPPDLEYVGFTTNIDSPKYRLKDNVQPKNFLVDLDVYLSESRFNGRVQIEVETLRENLTQIVLHQNVESIFAITVLDANDQPVILQSRTPFETDNYYEILKINFAFVISPGRYTIIINYSGRINENPVDRGFYKGYYYVNNSRREYATTQFQPFHARKAFPCFDEPQFKCPFTISITRDSSLSPTFSNMAIASTDEITPGRITETFLRTPVISSYLIAFHVSDFVATNTSATAGKPVQIISRPGVTSQHGYAADMAKKITDGMDEYFDINYYDMGQGQPMKNDHIALPDFPSGAMENWGMVNYREAYLLYDEDHTNILDKLFIATIVAHELAHKWFGNLVTCFWWSNLWLNESFASYFEHFGAHMADPDLELDDSFITAQVQRALGADASPSITPMNWSEVADNPSVSSHFSTTSYVKGASVLRTIEHFIGYTTFRNALRYYLKDNAYGIGYPIDMYNALRKAVAEDASFQETYPNVDIGVVLDSWIQNPGSPVVNVDVNMNTGLISISQERFQLSGTPPNDLWHIPITWTHGGNASFTNLKPSRILSGRNDTIQNIAGHYWVILNLQQSGLYRVNYDDHNWEMLASQLRRDKNVIHKLNRAQIVNDVLYFLRAGKIKIQRVFDVLSFLKDESDYYVWNGALAQLDWIRSRLEHLPTAHKEFSAYILDMFSGAIEQLGYNQNDTDTISIIQSRMQVLNYACLLGHEGCISDSVNKWNAFRSNPNSLVAKNARRYVYCNGLRQGNASDYNFLFERYNTSENTADMVVMLRALACTKDEASLTHYLFESMHNSKIRIHDRTNAFNYALQGNKDNLKIVLKFLYENYQEIRETYGGEARLSTAINALASYLTDYNDIVEFQAWVYANQVQLAGSFRTGQGVINTAMNNIGWGNDVAKEIVLSIRGSSAAVTASFTLLLLAITAHIFK